MRFKLFVFILALQSAWVLGTTFKQERVLRVGKAILLETQPVDPRDLLSGDFIRLNYKISDVPANLFSPPVRGSLPAGSTVFVTLKRGGQYYDVARASTQEFDPASGEVLLRGRSNPGPGSLLELFTSNMDSNAFMCPKARAIRAARSQSRQSFRRLETPRSRKSLSMANLSPMQ
jgi:hypothetical protein